MQNPIQSARSWSRCYWVLAIGIVSGRPRGPTRSVRFSLQNLAKHQRSMTDSADERFLRQVHQRKTVLINFFMRSAIKGSAIK